MADKFLRIVSLGPFLYGIKDGLSQHWIDALHHIKLLVVKEREQLLTELRNDEMELANLIDLAVSLVLKHLCTYSRSEVEKMIEILYSLESYVKDYTNYVLKTANHSSVIKDLWSKIFNLQGDKILESRFAVVYVLRIYFFEVSKNDFIVNMNKRILTEKKRVDSIRVTGNKYYNEKNHREAVKYYSKALKKCRLWDILYSNRAQAFLKLTKPNAALSDAKRAIVINPTWKAWLRFAQANYDMAHYGEALQANKIASSIWSSLDNPHEATDIEAQKQDILDAIYAAKAQEEASANNAVPRETPYSDVPALISSDESGPSEAEVKTQTTTSSRKRSRNRRSRSRSMKQSTQQQPTADQAAGSKAVSHASRNSFPETAISTNRDPASISPSKTKAVMDEVIDLCTSGTKAYTDERWTVAIDAYREALDMVVGSNIELNVIDHIILEFAYSMANIEMHLVETINRGIQNLNDVLNQQPRFSDVKFPMGYYAIGRGYVDLCRFHEAVEPLNIAKRLLNNGHGKVALFWPGSNSLIRYSRSTELHSFVDELIKVCKHPATPHGLCHSHIDSPDMQLSIYLKDPGFKGCVMMICRSECRLNYHPACWKKLKQIIGDRTTDKDMLDTLCPTPDCGATIHKIKTLNQNLKEHQIVSEKITAKVKDEREPAYKMPKSNIEKIERKEQKKDRRKQLRKERFLAEEQTDWINENETATAPDVSNVEPDNRSDAVTVLTKDGNDSDNDQTAKHKNAKKKKPPKVRSSVDVTAELYNPASYDGPGLQDYHVDIDDGPFSIQHQVMDYNLLYQTEGASAVVDNDRSRTENNINSYLYSYFAEILDEHGPMLLDDQLLMHQLEHFPLEYQMKIEDSGGLRSFLMGSLKFSIIGNLVCIQRDVVRAREMAACKNPISSNKKGTDMGLDDICLDKDPSNITNQPDIISDSKIDILTNMPEKSESDSLMLGVGQSLDEAGATGGRPRRFSIGLDEITLDGCVNDSDEYSDDSSDDDDDDYDKFFSLDDNFDDDDISLNVNNSHTVERCEDLGAIGGTVDDDDAESVAIDGKKISSNNAEDVVCADVNLEDKNSDDKVSDDKNSDDENLGDKYSDDKNSDDKNSDEKKSDDKNSDDINSDDINSDDKNSDDKNSADKNSDDNNIDDIQKTIECSLSKSIDDSDFKLANIFGDAIKTENCTLDDRSSSSDEGKIYVDDLKAVIDRNEPDEDMLVREKLVNCSSEGDVSADASRNSNVSVASNFSLENSMISTSTDTVSVNSAVSGVQIAVENSVVSASPVITSVSTTTSHSETENSVDSVSSTESSSISGSYVSENLNVAPSSVSLGNPGVSKLHFSQIPNNIDTRPNSAGATYSNLVNIAQPSPGQPVPTQVSYPVHQQPIYPSVPFRGTQMMSQPYAVPPPTISTPPVRTYYDEYTELCKEIGILKASNSELSYQLEEKMKEISALNSKTFSLYAVYQTKQSENEQKNEEIFRLNESGEKTSASLKKAKQTIQELEMKRESLREDLQLVMKEKEDESSQCKELRTENVKLMERLEESQKSFVAVSTTTLKLKDKYQKLESEAQSNLAQVAKQTDRAKKAEIDLLKCRLLLGRKLLELSQSEAAKHVSQLQACELIGPLSPEMRAMLMNCQNHMTLCQTQIDSAEHSFEEQIKLLEAGSELNDLPVLVIPPPPQVPVMASTTLQSEDILPKSLHSSPLSGSAHSSRSASIERSAQPISCPSTNTTSGIDEKPSKNSSFPVPIHPQLTRSNHDANTSNSVSNPLSNSATPANVSSSQTTSERTTGNGGVAHTKPRNVFEEIMQRFNYTKDEFTEIIHAMRAARGGNLKNLQMDDIVRFIQEKQSRENPRTRAPPPSISPSPAAPKPGPNLAGSNDPGPKMPKTAQTAVGSNFSPASDLHAKLPRAQATAITQAPGAKMTVASEAKMVQSATNRAPQETETKDVPESGKNATSAAADPNVPKNTFDKLVMVLSKIFPEYSKLQFRNRLGEVRQDCGGTFSDLSQTDIINKVTDRILAMRREESTSIEEVAPSTTVSTVFTSKATAITTSTAKTTVATVTMVTAKPSDVTKATSVTAKRSDTAASSTKFKQSDITKTTTAAGKQSDITKATTATGKQSDITKATTGKQSNITKATTAAGKQSDITKATTGKQSDITKTTTGKQSDITKKTTATVDQSSSINECTICMETMRGKDCSELRCNHIFHDRCLRKWVRVNSTCPICRDHALLADEFPPLKK